MVPVDLLAIWPCNKSNWYWMPTTAIGTLTWWYIGVWDWCVRFAEATKAEQRGIRWVLSNCRCADHVSCRWNIDGRGWMRQAQERIAEPSNITWCPGRCGEFLIVRRCAKLKMLLLLRLSEARSQMQVASEWPKADRWRRISAMKSICTQSMLAWWRTNRYNTSWMHL